MFSTTFFLALLFLSSWVLNAKVKSHLCNNIKTTNLISDLMKRVLQVSVVVTPESGLISASIPLAPLKSGLQAATSTLDQVQVEATV